MNNICKLFNISYPIVQAGMIWCSGWRLASAVSNAGGLGIIGAGSMYPDVLKLHIEKCKAATQKPFGVNVPLLYPDVDALIQIIIEQKVEVVITSAGNPKTWTQHLKQHGIKVVHVVSNTKFALKSVEAGVDAIVAEGFEAGGHNGREETTTMCLIPMIVSAVTVPVIAAGGIGSGRAMLAAFALGAQGVQVGSRFVNAIESSAHDHFKQAIINSKEGDTQLLLKKLTPVRLLRNAFQQRVIDAENTCADTLTLTEILGRARAKKGMFEGDMIEGELEIGQVSAAINETLPAATIVKNMMLEFDAARVQMDALKFI
ncbi:MAG: nitronate monooxygenase [Bacteroidia bacterium]|nr:nitronate monooxygenase [Bacteroidia bacterium]HQV00243.1 nitronate monooxygenase [Bacteroidia bacterium]